MENANKRKGWKELLDNINVLVDGKFQIEKKVEGLRFRGSANQRIVDVKKSMACGDIVTLEY